MSLHRLTAAACTALKKIINTKLSIKNLIIKLTEKSERLVTKPKLNMIEYLEIKLSGILSKPKIKPKRIK
jgi:hypothetical protein